MENGIERKEGPCSRKDEGCLLSSIQYSWSPPLARIEGKKYPHILGTTAQFHVHDLQCSK